MHTLLPMTFLPSWSIFFRIFLLLLLNPSDLRMLLPLADPADFCVSRWARARSEFRSVLHRQHIFLFCCDCLYQNRHTKDTYKNLYSADHIADLVSLVYIAFYLPAKTLKFNGFMDLRQFSIQSPDERLKLDYRIISNVITLATYATLIPFVWKNCDIFGFGCFVFINKVGWNLLRLKLMKNGRIRNLWKICYEKKKQTSTDQLTSSVPYCSSVYV